MLPWHWGLGQFQVKRGWQLGSSTTWFLSFLCPLICGFSRKTVKWCGATLLNHVLCLYSNVKMISKAKLNFKSDCKWSFVTPFFASRVKVTWSSTPISDTLVFFAFLLIWSGPNLVNATKSDHFEALESSSFSWRWGGANAEVGLDIAKVLWLLFLEVIANSSCQWMVLEKNYGHTLQPSVLLIVSYAWW